MTFAFCSLHGFLSSLDQRGTVDIHNIVSSVLSNCNRGVSYLRYPEDPFFLETRFLEKSCVTVSVFSFIKIGGFSIYT